MHIKIVMNENWNPVQVEPIDENNIIEVLAQTEPGHTTYVIYIADSDLMRYKHMGSEQFYDELVEDEIIAKFQKSYS